MKLVTLAFACALSGCVGNMQLPFYPTDVVSGNFQLSSDLLCSVFDVPQASSLPCGPTDIDFDVDPWSDIQDSVIIDDFRF